jgi:transposase-like protein
MSKKKTHVHRGRAFWENAVREFVASGQSQAEFARARGLAPSTLGRWAKLLGPEEEAVVRSELIEIVSTPPAQLQMTMGTARLQVGGAAVEFSDLPPVPYMAELLRAVSTC